MNRALRILTSSLLLAAGVLTLSAQKKSTGRNPELDAMNNTELITSLDLGKNADLVRQFQIKEATRLINGPFNPKTTGANVETYRNKEVIIITIPADKLFAPNETQLSDKAATYLTPLKRFLKPGEEDVWRVLLVMHTDNTGSEAYTDRLSMQRVESVFVWLQDAGASTSYLFPSARGASDPLNVTPEGGVKGANDTMQKRAANRRLEIYLIPGKKMLESAKKGRIAY